MSGPLWAQVPQYLRGNVTPSELAVYVALSWRIDARGTCFPGYATIATDAGVSVATVKRSLATLLARGVIAQYRRKRAAGGIAYTYRIDPLQPIDLDVWEAVAHCEPSTVAPSEPTREFTVSHEEEPPEEEPEVSRTKETQADRSVAGAPSLAGEFDEWWKSYPRHIGRKAAFTAYKRARKDATAEALLLAAAAYWAYTTRERTEQRFIPHPTTWLNQGRWSDERPASRVQHGRVDVDFATADEWATR